MSPEGESQASEWASRSHPVREDMDFQRATWRVERAGWLVLAVLVVLALLGLFASGPLASSTVTGATGRLEVMYQRFERSGAPSRLEIRLKTASPEKTVVRISAPFLEAFTLETIRPVPVEERVGPDGAELVFLAAGGASLGLHVNVKPEKAGLVRSEISIDGGPAVRLMQFIYP